jgi:hypothetical protein
MRIMTRVASPMLSDCRGQLRVAIILAYFGLKINYLCQFLAKALSPCFRVSLFCGGGSFFSPKSRLADLIKVGRGGKDFTAKYAKGTKQTFNKDFSVTKSLTFSLLPYSRCFSFIPSRLGRGRRSPGHLHEFYAARILCGSSVRNPTSCLLPNIWINKIWEGGASPAVPSVEDVIRPKYRDSFLSDTGKGVLISSWNWAMPPFGSSG